MSITYGSPVKLKGKIDGNVHPEAIVHSDQWFHYTYPDFQKCVKQ